MNEYEKFQFLLKWFVRQLRINNDILPGQHLSGQGYKNHDIRNSHNDWREYTEENVDVALQSGFQKDRIANYVHWEDTWIDVLPEFRKNAGQRSDVIELYIVDKKDNVIRKEYLRRTVEELGVSTFENDGEPNEVLIDFFNTFKKAFHDYNTELITLPEEIVSNVALTEGSKTNIVVNAYERNTKARNKCIEHYGARCQICDFDFALWYGSDFAGKVTVHHIKPLSEIGGEYQVDPINDLIPVCPNCHFVLHCKKDGVYTVEEVKTMIEAHRRG